MLDKQLERELKLLIKKEKIQMELEIEQANQHVGYVKPKPKFENLYIEGWLDNKRYANIKGLETFILNHQELSVDEIKYLIVSKPIMFRFLNHVLQSMPNLIELIIDKGAYISALMYVDICNDRKLCK